MTVKSMTKSFIRHSYFILHYFFVSIFYYQRHVDGQLKTDPIGKVTVHHDCRRKFVDSREASQVVQPNKSQRLATNSDTIRYEWKLCCFLCEKDNVDKSYYSVVQVMTIPLRQTLLSVCEPREDEWSNDVQRRLLSCNDLVAEEALYHSKCMLKFRLTRPSENKKGCPNYLVMTDNFEKTCNWLEEYADCELYTLNELHDKMIELSEGCPCYSKKSLKCKLIECYGDHISFAQRPGQPDLIYFQNFSWFIINVFKKIKMQTPLDIINAATKIFKSDIRNMPCNKKEYPTINNMDKSSLISYILQDSMMMVRVCTFVL